MQIKYSICRTLIQFAIHSYPSSTLTSRAYRRMIFRMVGWFTSIIYNRWQGNMFQLQRTLVSLARDHILSKFELPFERDRRMDAFLVTSWCYVCFFLHPCWCFKCMDMPLLVQLHKKKQQTLPGNTCAKFHFELPVDMSQLGWRHILSKVLDLCDDCTLDELDTWALLSRTRRNLYQSSLSWGPMIPSLCFLFPSSYSSNETI